jgi:hypothetical protein
VHHKLLDEITDTYPVEVKRVMPREIVFDAAIDVLAAGDTPMVGFLRTCEDLPPRLLGRHEHRNAWERQLQQA